MDLRPELLAPRVDLARIAELSVEIDRIADLLESGLPTVDAIARFNESTGHEYVGSDFAGYYGWRDVAEFAREAARPAWPLVTGVTREELVEVVRRSLQLDEDADYYRLLFDVNVVHLRAGELAVGPVGRAVDPSADPSAEEIVDAALRIRPTRL